MRETKPSSPLRRRALVVGATGMQGGAVARAMRRTGMQVVCARP